jgi:hypothetical protein
MGLLISRNLTLSEGDFTLMPASKDDSSPAEKLLVLPHVNCLVLHLAYDLGIGKNGFYPPIHFAAGEFSLMLHKVTFSATCYVIGG